MDYTKLLETFLTTSVITGGLIYLAKVIIDKFIESKVEKYKNFLQKDTESFKHNLNVQADKFKHDLNTISTEHQIRYTKLYEERGQIVKLIYRLLLELENSLASLTTIWQGSEWTTSMEKDKFATDNIKNLKKELEENRIFFSIDLCKKIDSILLDSHKITVDMHMVKMDQQKNDRDNKQGNFVDVKDLLSPTNTWHELDEKVRKEIVGARLDLAQEFRTLIGVA